MVIRVLIQYCFWGIFMELLSVIFSGIAAIGAFISVFISIRQSYASIISVKRFDWMNDLRNKVSQFLEIYFDSHLCIDDKKKKLMIKKLEIELYIDSRNNAGYDNGDHLAIATALDFCINSVDREDALKSECIMSLINSVQICLANTHTKAKDESKTYKKHF